MSDTNTESTTKQTYIIKNNVIVTFEKEIEAESFTDAYNIAVNYDITPQDLIDNGDFHNLGIDEMWTITDEDGNEETPLFVTFKNPPSN